MAILDASATTIRSTWAFNLGSDARLRGVSPTRNPFFGVNEYQALHWEMGWTHCNRFWGIDAKWPVRGLPQVRDEA